MMISDLLGLTLTAGWSRQVIRYDRSSRRFSGLTLAALMDSNPAIFLRITL